MSTITVVDTITGHLAADCRRDEVADTIKPWFRGAPAEVWTALDGLQVALNRGEPVDGYAAYLAVRFECRERRALVAAAKAMSPPRSTVSP